MPLEKAPPVEIPLGGTLQQSVARLFRGPDTLRDARNVEQSKEGGLRKRRGHRLLDLSTDTNGNTPEVAFVGVGTYREELTVYGRENFYAVHADTAIVDGASVTLRGPTMVGDWDRLDIHSAAIAEES